MKLGDSNHIVLSFTFSFPSLPLQETRAFLELPKYSFGLVFRSLLFVNCSQFFILSLEGQCNLRPPTSQFHCCYTCYSAFLYCIPLFYFFLKSSTFQKIDSLHCLGFPAIRAFSQVSISENRSCWLATLLQGPSVPHMPPGTEPSWLTDPTPRPHLLAGFLRPLPV